MCIRTCCKQLTKTPIAQCLDQVGNCISSCCVFQMTGAFVRKLMSFVFEFRYQRYESNIKCMWPSVECMWQRWIVVHCTSKYTFIWSGMNPGSNIWVCRYTSSYICAQLSMYVPDFYHKYNVKVICDIHGVFSIRLV